MEYARAIEVLKEIMEKHPLSDEEKEAVTTAIGMLSWGALSKSKLKDLHARKEIKRAKGSEW
jgi:hypothetical protein